MLYGKKKEERNGRGGGIMVGGASLLAVFAVLCMTVFGTLSLTSAQMDRRLSEKNAETVKAFYMADSQGQKQLAQLSRALSETKDIPSAVASAGMSYREGDQGAEAVFQVAGGKNQVLSAVVRIDKGQYCKITEWSIVSEPAGHEGADLDVWKGAETEEK